MNKKRATTKSVRFSPARELKSSPRPSDYTHSGYDRGHLAPAEDMRWSEEALVDSYSMLNVTPQTPSFNRGTWKRLENQVRRWANEYDILYITTGPILTEPCLEKLLEKICVPKKHFKVILKKKGSSQRIIGFIIPQDARGDFSPFKTNLNELEKITQIEFFKEKIPFHVEANLPVTSKPLLKSDNSGYCPRDYSLVSANIRGCCSGHGGVYGPKKRRACCDSKKRVLCNNGTDLPPLSASSSD